MSGGRRKKSCVVVDSVGQCIRCTACGEEVPIPLGVFTWSVGVMKLFSRCHNECHRRTDRSGPRTWFSTIVPVERRKREAVEGRVR